MALDFFGANVNNVGLDPLQGYDFEVWTQDEATGGIAFFGAFQSLTLSVRNATETYLELGQRVPIYLDGEIQIAWVLEQGCVDMAFLTRTFGINAIERSKVVTRGPRFRISFDAKAAELVNTTGGEASQSTRVINNIFSNNVASSAPFSRQVGQVLQQGATFGTSNAPPAPTAQGQYELYRCKVDSVSLGLMPGRRVAALRWEGVSEGISFNDQSVQAFKTGIIGSTTRNSEAVPVGINDILANVA